jgi:hypothetical protein
LPRNAELSEADYLAREVSDAKAALLNTIGELRNGMASSADLRAWARRYPWAAVGAASVAGFAAGTAVTPAPGQSLQEKLQENLSRFQTNGEPQPLESPRPVREASATSTGAVSDKLISSIFDLAKTVIQTVILAAVRPPTASPPHEAEESDPWQIRVAK